MVFVALRKRHSSTYMSFSRSNGGRYGALAPSAALIAVFYIFLSFLEVKESHACGSIGSPDSLTPAGTDFLLCFEQNEQDGLSDDEVYQEIYVATLGQPATVTITTRGTSSYVRTITLAAREAHTVRIPVTVESVINTSELADDRVFRVTSSAPIVCYGLNHKEYSADAFAALPKSIAGLEFRVMSYHTSVSDPQPIHRPSQFAVAAFEDNTTVTIIPSAETRSGNQPGVPFKIVLEAGQCVQVQGRPLVEKLDMTGTIVRSDKLVTVYGSHVRTEIPSLDIFDPAGSSRDHLTESLPPVNNWGRKFVVSDYLFPGSDYPDVVRVLSLNANTQVKINGTLWKTLGENQFADSLYKGYLTIEADGPVLVGSFAHSSQRINDPSKHGDPFFMIVPPLEQSFNDFTFMSSPTSAYPQHFAVIVTEISGKDNVSVDGSLQSPLLFTDLPKFSDGSQYAITRLSVTEGAHNVTTSNPYEKGIVVMAYGFGFIDSYGYTAGSLFKPTSSLVQLPDEKRAPIGSKKNAVTVRNMLPHPIWFDSSRIVLRGENAANYKVTLREDLIFKICEMSSKEELTLHLDVTPKLTEPLEGELLVYTHTPLWTDLKASKISFRLLPESAASVEDARATSVKMDISPSPATRNAQLSFMLEERGEGVVSLFDATGRLVMQLAPQMFYGGPNSVDIDVSELTSGMYNVELQIPSRSVVARQKLIVQ